MKNKRQAAILSLIEEYSIDTQEELTTFLQRKGFSCTQATVSRDIRELKLIKVADENGGYRYASTSENEREQGVKYSSILEETVKSTRSAGNMVVVKTFNGMAMAACAAIDAMKWEDVYGSIAGDDTIFLVAGSEKSAEETSERIAEMIVRKF